MNNEISKIMTDLADVYELSLSIGTSLELEKNCQTFYRSLVQRKNLSFIGVWHKVENALQLQSSFPNKKVINELFVIGESGLYFDILSNPEGEIFEIPLNKYDQFLRFDLGVTYGYYEDDSFILLAQNGAIERFTKREISQLNTLFSKFIISVKASLSHKMLLEEIIRRQGVEDRLFERESYFRFGANSLSEGIIVTDLDDRITYVNRAMENLTGYSRAEMIGSISNDLFKPIGTKDFVKDVVLNKQANDIGEVYEIQQVHKDGFVYWVRKTASPFKNPDNKIVGTIATMLNISDQKNSEQKLRLVIDTALDAVITMNQKGEITQWNKNAERIFGYTYDEVIGNNLSGYIIPEEYRAAHKAGMKHYFKTGEGPVLNQRIEITAIDKTGRVFPIELAITPVVQNDITFFSAFVRDISERKEIEKQKESLLNKLASLNKELTDYAYIISHDMKAPLRAVGSLTDIFYEDYYEVLDSAGKDLLLLLKGRVHRMYKMIDSLLTYSRIGKDEVSKQLVNVSSVVYEVIDSISFPKNIICCIESDLHSVWYHRIHLIQIFQNLISNSCIHMDKENGHIIISCYVTAEFYVFEVKDNGPGISHEYHDKVFEIFQTLQAKDDHNGTGVGLSIVRRIVESNGGKIALDSQPNEGVVFRFTIPKLN